MPLFREPVGDALALEVRRHEGDLAGVVEGADAGALEALGGRVIDLEHDRVGQRREPPSPRVEPGAEDHDLRGPRGARVPERIVDRGGAERDVIGEPERAEPQRPRGEQASRRV
ncbi:MAG TPA: hypothetical protein RMH99_27315 [Sandaracinaceae bacterium LLY-WYZ-13_1]|nr:hypothetical protein [Sandaracinaceae bacterium LLY-WYZ-13_1]